MKLRPGAAAWSSFLLLGLSAQPRLVHAQTDSDEETATEPASEEAPVPVDEPEVAPAPPAALPAPVGPHRPSPLDLKLGARLYGRSFRYTDSLAQLYPPELYPGANIPVLTDHVLPAAPMPFIQGTWYPAAHFTDGWLAHLGLRAGYEIGVATQVGFQSPGQARQLFQQQHSLWYAGLRGRLPLNVPELGRGELGLLADFANHQLSFVGDQDINGQDAFPNVDYKMVELGADTEWRVGGLILGAYFKYLLVLDTGKGPGQLQSPEWFPTTQAQGVDFGGNVGWELSRVFDVLLGVDFRAYGMNFNPVADDAPPNRQVGGATDRYISVWAGLGVHWPEDEPAIPAATPGAAPAAADDFDSFD